MQKKLNEIVAGNSLNFTFALTILAAGVLTTKLVEDYITNALTFLQNQNNF